MSLLEKAVKGERDGAPRLSCLSDLGFFVRGRARLDSARPDNAFPQRYGRGQDKEIPETHITATR